MQIVVELATIKHIIYWLETKEYANALRELKRIAEVD